jgi:hypothetical protein
MQAKLPNAAGEHKRNIYAWRRLLGRERPGLCGAFSDHWQVTSSAGALLLGATHRSVATANDDDLVRRAFFIGREMAAAGWQQELAVSAQGALRLHADDDADRRGALSAS